MSAVATPVTMHRPLPPEEAARGDFYALLSRLLMAPPDAALLATLAAAPAIPSEGRAELARAWRNLVDASSAMDADAAAHEYEQLFAGIGKADVSIYAGYYIGAPAIDHPRVRLQAELDALGLERRGEVSEPEDHLGGIFEVMRVLTSGGAGRAPATLGEQKRFFEAYVGTAGPRFFAAVGASKKANYYRHVAALGAAFLCLESDSFQLE